VDLVRARVSAHRGYFSIIDAEWPEVKVGLENMLDRASVGVKPQRK
jgi:hypothetical protein